MPNNHKSTVPVIPFIPKRVVHVAQIPQAALNEGVPGLGEVCTGLEDRDEYFGISSLHVL